MNPPSPQSRQKAGWLIGAILLTVSVSGYFMGLRQTGSQISMTRPVSLATPDAEGRAGQEIGTVPVAVAYARQDWLKEGPNAPWRSRLGTLVQPPFEAASLTNVTEAQRSEALAERAARRAYDGAPPVVPHPITQDSSASCLACHGPGLAIRDKVASRISHALYSNCTQCHVPDAGAAPGGTPPLLVPLAGNQFASTSPPLKGSRAWPQAPPTIPHSTLMRSDCLSCHGPRGLFGLRTPHPARQSCVQCHASDAGLDQHVFSSTSK